MAKSLLKDMPPLRAEPDAPDEQDGERAEFVRKLWDDQDSLLAARNRQVEENVRMVVGQQWSFYSPELNRFTHISEWLTPSERLWRQLPVVNLLEPWFMLTHSRLTENPPIVAFQPSTSDEMDAALAEVWDVIHKSQWREQGMEEVHDRLIAWLVVGGRAYLKSRVDPSGGGLVPLAPGQFQVPEGESPESFALPKAREGGLATDVLSPVEVRSAWGPAPFHMKPWHIQRGLLPAAEVEKLWGVKVDPDVKRDDAEANLSALLFSEGFYGSVDRPGWLGGTTGDDDEDLCTFDELWMAPCPYPGMEETEDSPGGRWMLRVGDEIVLDSRRPARFRWTSPIRAYDFVGLPGRPEGSTPQEMLNPIQRTYNRLLGLILEHAVLCTNPTKLIHQSVGVEEWSNEPGLEVEAAWAPGIPNPVQYLTPPPIGSDAYRALDLLEAKFDLLGSMRGTEPAKPDPGISGESVKELRYNADRPLGATAKRAAYEYSRWSIDQLEWIKVLWDQDRIIEYAGEDEILTTVTVSPQLWRGKIDVFADTESMLPEGRGARQDRVERMYDKGILGDPMNPATRRRFLELARFPHLGRDTEEFSSHRRSAKRAIAAIVQSEKVAEDVALYRWYRFDVWMTEVEEYLSAPEFLKLDPNVQGQLALLYELVMQAMVAQAQDQAAKAAYVMQSTQAAGAQGAAAAGAPAPSSTAKAGSTPGPVLTPGGTL